VPAHFAAHPTNGTILPHTQQHTLIRRAIQDVWNDGRIDKADEFFALDYVNHGGLIPDLVYGPEAIRISVILYRRAFPRLYISVDELRKDGEVFILKWTARNKRVFRLPRVTFKTDPPDQLAGHIQIRIADGKIAESWMSLSEDSLKAIIPSSLAA
jgi:predicted SnoaL-like aldol condensation-catalyzing enzyme